MAINVYIDNNVWDFLFERQLDLAVELPREEWRLCITRETEFEVSSIPSKKLKDFIASTVAKCGIRTDAFFGFNDDGLPPDEQRVGGWDIGQWASPEEVAFAAQQKTALKTKKRPTKLHQGEADISLAARSLHSVVLSLDAKTGPINDAYKQGGRVVFLTDFDKSGLSLANFIKARV